MRWEKKNSRSKKAPSLAIQGSFPCYEKLINRFNVNRCEDPVKDQDSKTQGEQMRSISARTGQLWNGDSREMGAVSGGLTNARPPSTFKGRKSVKIMPSHPLTLQINL